jgi:uncharacterized membrane protein YbhN (UPF0104 family)
VASSTSTTSFKSPADQLKRGALAVGLLFDLLSLDLMFFALRYQPGFGPLAVAYGAANIASAIRVTPGGLG